MSFVDIKFGDWPIILITNPKHAGYISPNIEPIYRIKKSTHIRFVALHFIFLINNPLIHTVVSNETTPLKSLESQEN